MKELLSYQRIQQKHIHRTSPSGGLSWHWCQMDGPNRIRIQGMSSTHGSSYLDIENLYESFIIFYAVTDPSKYWGLYRIVVIFFFSDNISKCIFFNEKYSLTLFDSKFIEFILKGPIANKSAFVQLWSSSLMDHKKVWRRYICLLCDTGPETVAHFILKWPKFSFLQDKFYDNVPSHDDVIKWKHFPRNWPFVLGIHRSPVNSPHKGQWRGALMFS